MCSAQLGLVAQPTAVRTRLCSYLCLRCGRDRWQPRATTTLRRCRLVGFLDQLVPAARIGSPAQPTAVRTRLCSYLCLRCGRDRWQPRATTTLRRCRLVGFLDQLVPAARIGSPAQPTAVRTRLCSYLCLRRGRDRWQPHAAAALRRCRLVGFLGQLVPAARIGSPAQPAAATSRIGHHAGCRA